MSPKRKVAILTAVLAAFGIGVSLAIIAAGGGFSGAGPSLLNPPSSRDIWQVGANLHNGTILDYIVTARAENSSLDSAQLSMNFKDVGGSWQVKFVIVNGTRQTVEKTMMLSKELTREGGLDNSFRQYFDPIRASVLAVRDMDYNQQPKYLVVGAPWDEIYVGSSSIIVRVTGQETIQTRTGSFDAFILSYKLQDKTSKIWMVRDMPLPVKAEVYDAADNLLYKFELVKMTGISSVNMRSS